MVASNKKLLVFGLKGLLIDAHFAAMPRLDGLPQKVSKLNHYFVYRRPFYEEFLDFCIENFVVGVWSSSLGHLCRQMEPKIFVQAGPSLQDFGSVESLTGGITPMRLLPISSKETEKNWRLYGRKRSARTQDLWIPKNHHRPLFLKELSRLWSGEYDLPWEAGAYGPSNTLLIDDCSYKAIENPACTGIFPKTFVATDEKDDFLVTLRQYLEGLIQSPDVQTYVQSHAIGGPSMTIGDPNWSRIFNQSNRRPTHNRRTTGHMSLYHDLAPPPNNRRPRIGGDSRTQRLARNGEDCEGKANRRHRR